MGNVRGLKNDFPLPETKTIVQGLTVSCSALGTSVPGEPQPAAQPKACGPPAASEKVPAVLGPTKLAGRLGCPRGLGSLRLTTYETLSGLGKPFRLVSPTRQGKWGFVREPLRALL